MSGLNSFIQASTILLPTVYLVAALLHGMAFAGDRAPSFAARWRGPVRIGALILHAGMLTARWKVAGTFPVDGAWLLVSATVFVVALLHAVITARIARSAVGSIVLATAALFQTFAAAFGPVRAIVLPAADSIKILHVSTVVLATAALVLSGLFGYLHLLLLRQLRQKSFGPLYRQLPDLEQLARMTRRAAGAGFLFLTLGLNVGIFLAHKKFQDFDYADPHVILTIALWIHFGLIAFSRRIGGWTARRASIAAVLGLATLILTILITLVPAATFHQLN